MSVTTISLAFVVKQQKVVFIRNLDVAVMLIESRQNVMQIVRKKSFKKQV